MTEHSSPDWDPRASSILRDQRQAYDEMRERCPVAHSDFLNWSLFRHADIDDVLADPVSFSSVSRHRAVPNGMDQPEHTRYRNAIEPYFMVDQMTAFEPHCRRIAADLVQAMIANRVVDFVSSFAQPFSAQTLCALLGWPIERWKPIWGWTHGNQEAAFSQDREAGAALAREFSGFVHEAILTRQNAGVEAIDDLTTSLMAVEVDGEQLSEEELVSLLRNWTAGHGTVAAALGNLAFYLAQNPDAQRRLREEPALLPAAIDEILRVDGPLVANRRTTTRDVEIGGRKIAAGEKITLNWIAANRDARAFDNPENVRFDRDPTANLLFGKGIHDCVGAPLARLEMRVALEELLGRTSTIALETALPVTRAVYPSNGVVKLQLRLE